MSGRRTSALATAILSASTTTTVNGTTTVSNGGRARRSSPNNNNNNSNSDSFHPKLITTQILALQCFHYFLLAFLYQINSVLFNTSITVDRIFTDRYIRLWHTTGWPDVAATVVASVVGSVLLAVIVEKSKKCLDFGVTLFLIDFVACWLYGGFPTVLDWWIVHIFGMIVMVLLGEYLCSRRELDDIPLLQI